MLLLVALCFGQSQASSGNNTCSTYASGLILRLDFIRDQHADDFSWNDVYGKTADEQQGVTNVVIVARMVRNQMHYHTERDHLGTLESEALIINQ